MIDSIFRFQLDEADNELSDIKWKHDILNESFDSAYHTVASGRSTGYSTRSRPTSSRSRYTENITPSVTLSTSRLLGEDMSPAYTPRSLYSQGYGSDDESPVEDCYTPYQIKLSSHPKKKSSILVHFTKLEQSPCKTVLNARMRRKANVNITLLFSDKVKITKGPRLFQQN